ncbi:MAG: hypothetical protein J7578_17770 [Chitinophagaceae bacterium]|nr:hypothetical protein [Chitinophagaceae bacterium]
MNERQPYEQHLAEKMQQLPPPMEQDKAWDQMKVLLDKELPRGNGSGGNNRWWLFGMIAGILFIGTWIYQQQPGPGNTIAAKKPTAVDTSPNASQPDQESIANLPPMQHPPGANRSTPATEEKAGTSRANSEAARTDQPIHSAKRQTNPDGKSTSDPAITDDDVGKTSPPIQITQNNKPPAYTENSTLLSNSGINKTGKNKELPGQPNHSSSNAEVRPNTYSNELYGSIPRDIDAGSFQIRTDQLLRGQQMNGKYAGDHSLISQNVALANKNAMRKIARSKEKAFSIGLSLPLAFPVADQKALGYNYRGGSNTVSDYIPSPHVQYHVNNRTYFQTEIQVVTPQYIRPILMYQEKYMSNPNTWMYNSVYARKLYYFNLPVSVYHSPLPNFFLGTGLQFSSLMSGVAMYEHKKVYGNQETILSQQFSKMNYDSLTNRMSNSELRLLLDVNYYWQRFTVGLRYNQAFGNYASFRLNNTTGYTYDKNKALFFYLRYNIWEDKKRSVPGRSMLSLK